MLHVLNNIAVELVEYFLNKPKQSRFNVQLCVTSYQFVIFRHDALC